MPETATSPLRRPAQVLRRLIGRALKSRWKVPALVALLVPLSFVTCSTTLVLDLVLLAPPDFEGESDPTEPRPDEVPQGWSLLAVDGAALWAPPDLRPLDDPAGIVERTDKTLVPDLAKPYKRYWFTTEDDWVPVLIAVASGEEPPLAPHLFLAREQLSRPASLGRILSRGLYPGERESLTILTSKPVHFTPYPAGRVVVKRIEDDATYLRSYYLIRSRHTLWSLGCGAREEVFDQWSKTCDRIARTFRAGTS